MKPTIVLVHGGYADSSCWNATIQELQYKGYTTICGSNPLRGIPTDAPYIGSLLDSIAGPVVLVAHSMGGTVITNAAAGKTNVTALVYIAAFVPDVGETQGELITKFPGSEVAAVQDKAIPPACERWMYARANARHVVEVPTSSHVAMISHPMVVAELIQAAAEATA